jgi:hypothetical protein
MSLSKDETICSLKKENLDLLVIYFHSKFTYIFYQLMFIQNARKSVESTYYQTIEKYDEEKRSFESRIKELEVFK